jgi:hypothetical protein
MVFCLPLIHIDPDMTLRQFSKLSKEAQVNFIKKAGSFLFIRHEAGIDIMLYQIEGFYAEVFFDSVDKNSIRIRSFDDLASLDIYLKEINLSELQPLLQR